MINKTSMIEMDISINNIWNYFISLEENISETSRYIEPYGQEDVHSFEFAKILILSCTELESIFKLICNEACGQKCGNIEDYKKTILSKYPKIIYAQVKIPRLGKTIMPFEKWDKNKLSFWGAYTDIKHNRKNCFEQATYKNAVYALSALYVSIAYLSEITNQPIDEIICSKYIISNYFQKPVLSGFTNSKLPDFDPSFDVESSLKKEINSHTTIYSGDKLPKNSSENDIAFIIESNKND